MANAVYPKFKKAATSGGANVNVVTGTVKIAMIDTGAYTYDAAHEFLADVPTAAIIGTSNALAGKAVTDAGAFTSENARFDSVTGASVEALLWFVDTGARATSRLIAFQDTDVTNLPVTPDGDGFNVIMDSYWFTF
jgi:hypothetical protein